MTFLYVLAIITIVLGIVALLQGVQAARYVRKTTKGPEAPCGRAALAPRKSQLNNFLDLSAGLKPRGHRKEDKNSRIVVFCPCKGTDSAFEKNIRSILDQDYPNFRVQFVVESENDSAYRTLQGLGITPILVAGPASDRGQKVHNLACAAEHAGRDAGIYVFCDSDARYPKDWLSNLTAPLARPQVGAATGYRWYAAQSWHLPTLLRSAWNAVAVSALGEHDRNFTWGGSLAIRRETFDRIGVLKAWQGAVSDDYAITRAVRWAGLKIIFVPSCLIPSYGECGWAELLEFTTRQMILTRVYYPGLWRLAFLTYTLFNLTFVWLAIAAFGDAVAAALLLGIYVLTAARAWVRLESVNAVLPPAALSKGGWFYILCSPLVSLLYLYNVIHSALSSSIVWRQIHYKLVSPNETRVTR